jgi:hypothetical protein
MAPDNRAWNLHEYLASSIVFLAALVLYILTLAPSYVWGDSTKLLFYVLEKEFVGLPESLVRFLCGRISLDDILDHS